MPRPSLVSPGLGGAAWVLDADPSALRTMQTMGDLCHQATANQAVVRYANELIENTRSRDYPAQIAALRMFGEQYFRFVNNPGAVQRIRTPLDMLNDIERKGSVWGACDDAAALMATLGMANGLRARFRAVALCQGAPPPEGACRLDDSAQLTHVIADLWDGGDWVPLDITKPQDLWRPPTVVRTLTLEV
jgi:transglutaminase-like putative cysteine protease